MQLVVTAAGRIICPHQPPATAAATPGQAVLTVTGHPVLLGADLNGAPIADCTNLPTPAKPDNKPCTRTTGPAAGVATVLTVSGVPVLLADAGGPTESFPLGNWSVGSAGQSILKAT